MSPNITKSLTPIIVGSFILSLVPAAYVLKQHIAGDIKSKTAISFRQKAVINIAKHVLSDTCWQYRAKFPLKIGDAITFKGSTTGKVPTSCAYSPNTKQFVEIGYLDGELQAVRIFSIKEVQNAKSQLISEGDK